MTLSSVVRTGSQRPRLSNLLQSKSNATGSEAVEWVAAHGLILDDWQAWVLENLLAEDESARLVASSAVLILPRQNGKNAILEALELFAFFVLDEPRILHTAHLGKTAADHMRRMSQLVRSNDDLDAITRIYWANGKEAFERIDTGARLEFITRGRKTARGGSPTRLVFDEALFLTDEQIQSIMPAMSAQSMNADPPQMVYTSSAPLPESTVLHRLRSRGMSGDAGRMFMAEWSIDADDPRLDDPAALTELLFESNPGMGIRIAPDWVIENELVTMSREAFQTERLGVVRASDGPSTVLANWSQCVDEAVHQVPVRLALSVGVEGRSASLAVCGLRLSDQIPHVEITDHRDGTWWVVDEALKATKALGVALTVDPRSPTSGVLAALVAAKVPLQQMTTADYVQACAALQIAVSNLSVRHIGQQPLDAAVAGADIRPVGDGGWAWSRKSSSVDITPLEAVTLALWAQSSEPPKPKPRFINLSEVLERAEQGSPT